MDEEQLRGLFEQVRTGAIEIDAAVTRMRHMPFEDLGFAKIDHHRALRHGMPEVIFAQGKTPEQVVAIARTPAGERVQRADHPRESRLRRRHRRKAPGRRIFPALGRGAVSARQTVRGKGKIAVVCAGTSDLPVAEEAHVTAEAMGNEVDRHPDIGVAGIHRLMHNRERLTKRACAWSARAWKARCPAWSADWFPAR